VAVLFLGLGDNSRTKKKLRGDRLTLEQTLLAMIADGINFLCWSKTKDAQKGKNKPKSILDTLRGVEKEKEVEAFKTPQELMAYFDAIERGEN